MFHLRASEIWFSVMGMVDQSYKKRLFLQRKHLESTCLTCQFLICGLALQKFGSKKNLPYFQYQNHSTSSRWRMWFVGLQHRKFCSKLFMENDFLFKKLKDASTKGSVLINAQPTFLDEHEVPQNCFFNRLLTFPSLIFC